MQDIIYKSVEEIKYITLGMLAEDILKGKGKISNLIDLQEKLIETDNRNMISEIYNKVLESR